MEEKIYPYKQKAWVGLFSTLLSGSIAYFLLQMGITNNRGLIINGSRLTSQEATTLYWLLLLISAIALIYSLLGFISSFSDRFIILSQDSLSFPKSILTKNVVRIPYRSIKQLQLEQVQGNRFLHVHHTKGKISIPEHMLPNKTAFEDLCYTLSSIVDF
ncbi:MAG TPA: hypothetical protein DCZ88_18685, partial [Pseudanabaena sp.]|nr:hypothetical protein [Pseudanabaena sp.]